MQRIIFENLHDKNLDEGNVFVGKVNQKPGTAILSY
jgi:hypothetical protein